MAHKTAPKTDQKPANELDKPAADRVDHGATVAFNLYRWQMQAIGGDDLADSANRHAIELVKRMKPRDPLEEMLVQQCLWTHARVARLSHLATVQTQAENLKTLNDAADRAANTYRRLMLALAGYRNPRRDSINVVAGQANVAEKQVNITATNEKGIEHETAAKMLSTDAGRPGFTPPLKPTGEAVAVGHRAKNAGRQGAKPDERAEAR